MKIPARESNSSCFAIKRILLGTEAASSGGSIEFRWLEITMSGPLLGVRSAPLTRQRPKQNNASAVERVMAA
jgi:hypothetical protein